MGDGRLPGWRTLTVLVLLIVLSTGAVSTGVYFWLNELDATYRNDLGVMSPGRLMQLLAQAERLGLLILPLGGWMVDRHGPRRVLLIATPLLGLAAILAGAAPLLAAPTVLLTIGAVRAVGVGLPTTTMANHRFPRRRATAIALLQFGGSVAGLIAGLVRESVGRSPTVVLGALLVIAVLPVARETGNQPEDGGQVPHGPPKAGDDALEPDYSWLEAVRGRTFWLFVLAATSLEVALLAGLTLFPEFLAERSVVAVHADQVVATTEAYRQIFATHNVVVAGFVLIGGVMADRMTAPRALRFFAMVHLVAIAVLWAAESLTMFFVAGCLFAAGHGGVAAANAAVVGEYFGRRRFAALLATSRLCVGVASQSGTLAVALLFDVTDDLIGVMAVAIILALAAVAAYNGVGNPQPSPSQRAAAASQILR